MKKLLILLCFALPLTMAGQCIADSELTFQSCLTGGATEITIPTKTPMPISFSVENADLSGVTVDLNNAIILFYGNTLIDSNTRFFGQGNALLLVADGDGNLIPISGNSGSNALASLADLNDAIATGNYSNLYDAALAAAGLLPVELAAFSGRPTTGGVLLEWVTVSEINNQYFEVQHSTDGHTFRPLAMIDGAGQSSSRQFYSYPHQDPAAGVNYYRLQQFDFDGSSSFSAVIVVKTERYGQQPVDVFPNPARHQVWLRTSDGEQPAAVFLVGMDGQRRLLSTTDGFQFRLPDLAAGLYSLVIHSGGKVAYSKLVISQ